jgi:phenylacetate-CoA ligase
MKELAYAWAYGDVLHPAWEHIIRKRPIRRHVSLLRQTQWLGADRLARLQGEELRNLLVSAGSRVPYYREAFARARFDAREVTSREHLAALPILTRETLRERYDELIDASERDRTIRKQTSGTTGVPLRFEYSNRSETWRQATRLRAYEWAGYRPGLLTLHYWGTGTRVPRGIEALKVRLDRMLGRDLYVDCGRQDEAAMRELASLIVRKKPHVIVAYTQALAAFARWVDETSSRAWDDIPIICGAEAMAPAHRDWLVRAFGRRVFETYGARETMLIAAECDAHDGMHVAEENLIVEIVREDGTPAAPGETGAVVVTDLHNRRMPMIRYANGDRATWGPARACLCGRTLRRIARVDGRINETMRAASGAPVPGMLFISLLNGHAAEIRAFQALQRKSGAVELFVVPGSSWSTVRFEATARRLEAYFDGYPLRVTLVDSIGRDASGKWRPVVVEQ